MVNRNSIIAIVITVLGLFTPYSFADITIVTSENPAALAAAKKVQAEISAPSNIKFTPTSLNSSDITVALGNEALTQALEKNTGHIVGAFINYSDITSASHTARIIYSDPSPKSVALFLDRNFSHAKIGFIYTDSDKTFADSIEKFLQPNNNKIIAIAHNGNTFNGINALSKMNINIMFIGRNKNIYQPENIRFVLESLFRKKIPVITTSKTLVKAGAAISIAPSDAEIMREIHTSVNRLLKQGDGSQPSPFIEELEIISNHSMIEFFNWQIKENDQ